MYNLKYKKGKEEERMFNPKYERTEALQCAGCTAAQFLVGFAPDMNYITLACISNLNAIAY